MPATVIDQAELPSMLATLCSYENFFGPYHPQTLALMTQLAIAYLQAGDLGRAQPLLERAVRDFDRHLNRDHDLRLQAIAALRDLFVAQRQYQRAATLQRELLDRQIQRLGRNHPETQASHAELAGILLQD